MGGVVAAGGSLLKVAANSTGSIEGFTASKAYNLAEIEASASVTQYQNFYRDGAAKLFPQELNTSSGIIIKANPDKTTTVIGTFRQDTEIIVNAELGLPKSMLIEGSTQPGAFNLLNTPDSLHTALGPEKFWTQINKPWLDAAIQRGDDIAVATTPNANSMNRIFPDGTIERSGFGREYDYLTSKGYKYDATTGLMTRGGQ
jgi:hypothetical protein